MSNYKRETEHGPEFFDGQCWIEERHVCHHCQEQREAEDKPYRWGEMRYSFGCYAGRYCDECWPKSGFRDATDPDAQFSELDAGERMDADY